MNYIDVIILAFLAWGAYRGFSRGLILEIATLVGLVLGIYFAIEYSPYTEEVLHDFFNISSKCLNYIALAVTFLVVVLVIFIVAKLLTKLVNIIFLGFINKLLGVIFGVLRYAVIVCVLLLIVDALNEKFQFISEEILKESIFFQPFLNFAQGIYNDIRF